MDQRDPDHTEELIEERVALSAIPRVERRVVELDRDDWCERRHIAEHEVHVLGGHAVERGVIHLAVGYFAEVANADLQQDQEAIADRVL